MMEFIDLKSQYARIEERLQARLRAILESGRFIMGPEVAELETALAAWVGSRHCVSCANGTDALHLALLNYGVGVGDAILTTPFTFAATAEVIGLCGATPVFVDVHPRSYNIDPEALKAALVELRRQKRLRARGIIAVNLFGLPADYVSIMQLARAEGLFVIEDAAQSYGASYKGKRSPTFGDVGTTSFFPAKPLGCYGDGGALFTDDDAIADRLRSLRLHGQGSHKYEHKYVGVNSRLDTLQAGVLLEKLRIFPSELTMREEVARRYTEALSAVVQTPEVPAGHQSTWAQYSVCHRDRDRIIAGLRECAIPSMIYYPIPLHLQPCFAHLGYRQGDLPIAESFSRQIFSLPMSPYLGKVDQDKVIAAVKSVVSCGRETPVGS